MGGGMLAWVFMELLNMSTVAKMLFIAGGAHNTLIGLVTMYL